jgi:hypothetical protein
MGNLDLHQEDFADNTKMQYGSGYSGAQHVSTWHEHHYQTFGDEHLERQESFISLQSVVQRELKTIERITYRVTMMAQAAPRIPFRRETAFRKEGFALPLINTIKNLVRETNLRVRDIGDLESTGMCCAILAMEYIERTLPYISMWNISAFFLAAYVIAYKILDDDAVSNTFWANLGGFSLKEFNAMESEFCDMLGWNFSISVRDFTRQKTRVIQP